MDRVLFLILLLLVLASMGTLGLNMVAKDRVRDYLSSVSAKEGCRVQEQTLTVERRDDDTGVIYLDVG